MNTHLDTLVASATSEAIDSPDQQAFHLLDDPDVAALFAEIDALVCAALTPVRCRRNQSPGAPYSGPGRLAGPVGHWSELGTDQCTASAPSNAALRLTTTRDRAQRPPRSTTTQGRQVMASQQI
jgi:hypothetical protein